MASRFTGKVFFIIELLLFLYVSFGIIIYLYQDSVIYRPNIQEFSQCPGFGDYKPGSYADTRFYYKEGGPNFVVYYHGNAGSACDRSGIKQYFEDENRTVLFVEYAGYSNSDKLASKDNIIQDVHNVDSYLKTQQVETLTVYGQSLGSGPATYHASISNVDTLILVSSFSSTYDLARKRYFMYPLSFLLRENFDNVANLEEYTGSVYLIHGESDTIIDPKYSQRLYDSVSFSKKEYILLPGVGHNDIWDSKQFQESITQILNRNITKATN